MSYRPYTKTSNGIQDWAIDAETVKGHAVETTGISSNTNTLATTAQVKAYVDANAGGVSINEVYPVGAIYISVSSTSPASLFGGTWEQLKDRFLLGAGSTYTAGNTGGESTHTLSENEMPRHNHKARTVKSGGSGPGSTISTNDSWSFYDESSETSFTGGNAAHNNMPPYLVVYMWKRTA